MHTFTRNLQFNSDIILKLFCDPKNVIFYTCFRLLEMEHIIFFNNNVI